MPLTGKELMLQNSRPFIILRLTPKAVDLVFIKHKQATGWGKFTCLIITSVTTGKAAAINPVTAVEPRVIEKTGGTKHVRGIAALLSSLPGEVARVRAEVNTLTFAVEFLRLHINVFFIA